MNTRERIYSLVLTALMIAMVTVATIVIQIPSPTEGFVNLGDGMVFLSVLLLGRNRGTVAASVGSALGDIISGYSVWAPWTFFIKGIMAFVLGLLIERMIRGSKPQTRIFNIPVAELLAMAVSGLIMVTGYYIAKAVMVGNWAAPIVGVPGNVFQFAVGIAVAIAVSNALYRTPSKKYFTYRIDELS